MSKLIKSLLDIVIEYSDLYEPIHATLMGSLPGIVIYFIKNVTAVKWIALILVLAPLITLIFANIGRVFIREVRDFNKSLIFTICTFSIVVMLFILLSLFKLMYSLTLVILITLINSFCIVIARELNVLKSVKHIAENIIYTTCLAYLGLVIILAISMYLLTSVIV